MREDMKAKTLAWMSLYGLMVAIGCDARTLIGQVPDGSAPGGSGGSGGADQPNLEPVGTMGHTCAPPQFPGDHPYAIPAGLEGVWTGYLEGGTLGITSDAIRLTLDHATDGTSQIHVVYGVLAPPPPATSATDPYPPGANYGYGGAPGSTIEGFSYTAHNVYWDAFGQEQRLRFLKNSAEPFASWCQLQSSYATPYPGGVDYSCLPGSGATSSPAPNDAGQQCSLTDSSGRPIKAVSCTQVGLCFGNYYCGCDSCGCDQQIIAFDGVPSGPGIFDILFDPAAGTASGSGIHLTRAAN
jgi:hypothetical protein